MIDKAITDDEEAFIQEERGKSERRDQLEDMRFLLSTPQGLRFFKRFLEDGSLFKTTFTGNAHSYFLEGHRNLALKVFRDICDASPEKLLSLIITKEKE